MCPHRLHWCVALTDNLPRHLPMKAYCVLQESAEASARGTTEVRHVTVLKPKECATLPRTQWNRYTSNGAYTPRWITSQLLPPASKLHSAPFEQTRILGYRKTSLSTVSAGNLNDMIPYNSQIMKREKLPPPTLTTSDVVEGPSLKQQNYYWQPVSTPTLKKYSKSDLGPSLTKRKQEEVSSEMNPTLTRSSLRAPYYTPHWNTSLTVSHFLKKLNRYSTGPGGYIYKEDLY